jgi:hypothetical protein
MGVNQNSRGNLALGKPQTKLRRLKSDQLSHKYFTEHFVGESEKPPQEHRENQKNSSLSSDGSRTTRTELHTSRDQTMQTKIQREKASP